MSESRVNRIRKAQAAFSRGDLSPAKDLVAEDVEWGSLQSWPGIDPVYRGPDALERWMETVRSAWELFDVETGEILLDTPELVVISERLRGRGRGSGVEVDMEVFSTYWFDRDEVVKRRVFLNREEALDAAERSE